MRLAKALISLLVCAGWSEPSWSHIPHCSKSHVTAHLSHDVASRRDIENSKLCFCDMKIMSRRNGGDSVNNESAELVVYQVTTIPE